MDAATRCAYEAYVGLRDGRMLYDIATTQDWLLRMWVIADFWTSERLRNTVLMTGSSKMERL